VFGMTGGTATHIPPRPTTRGDLLRTGALVAATAAQVLVPAIGPLLGQSEISEVSKRTKSIVTPPDWAFGVWGPIFAASAGTAVVQSLPGQRTSQAARSTGWLLAAAAAGNALWEAVAQSGRYRATPPILWGIVAAAGAAHTVFQRTESTPASRLAAGSNGMLLGWTGLAASINTADVLLDVLAIDPDTRRGQALSLGLVGAAAAGVTAVVAASKRAAAPVALTTSWGLTTLATNTGRPPVRATAWAAASSVAGGALSRFARTKQKLNLLG
jgi:tryptophan-rich sensory protein